MAGARKHGAHRYSMTLPPIATGGTGSDQAVTWTYDGFADGAATSNGIVFPYDMTSEQVVEAYVTVGTTYTGQATNFASIAFQQYSGSSTPTNDIRVGFSAAGILVTKGSPATLAVAAGAVATGAGTGTLLVSAGAALPWTLQAGDVLALARVSNNSTGQATNFPITLNFVTKQAGT